MFPVEINLRYDKWISVLLIKKLLELCSTGVFCCVALRKLRDNPQTRGNELKILQALGQNLHCMKCTMKGNVVLLIL